MSSSSLAAPSAGLGSYLRNSVILNVLAVLAVVGFFVGYLVMNTQASAKSFAIREMEERLAELEDRRRELDMQVMRYQSSASLQQMVSGKGFVPVASVEYLRKGDAAVAAK